MGREHKRILSVTVRSSLNNKHINLVDMTTEQYAVTLKYERNTDTNFT